MQRNATRRGAADRRLEPYASAFRTMLRPSITSSPTVLRAPTSDQSLPNFGTGEDRHAAPMIDSGIAAMAGVLIHLKRSISTTAKDKPATAAISGRIRRITEPRTTKNTSKRVGLFRTFTKLDLPTRHGARDFGATARQKIFEEIAEQRGHLSREPPLIDSSADKRLSRLIARKL